MILYADMVKTQIKVTEEQLTVKQRVRGWPR